MSIYKVAIAGVTGLVGQTMLRVLEERAFPVRELVPIASERSVGKELSFNDEVYKVHAISEDSFRDVDIALFALDSSEAAHWIPFAQKHCQIVIDNSSHFRLDEAVPLVVPEVNPADVFQYKTNLVANPNCSTIQLVAALQPLHQRFVIKRIVVSTYQAVSGAGQRGVDQMQRERKGDYSDTSAFPYAITKSILPQVAGFSPNGYTTEENKMMAETRKIMHDDSIRIAATCARVPILNCHAESVNVEFGKPFELSEIRELLSSSPGLILKDDPDLLAYPIVEDADGKDEVFVGRLRRDESVESGLALWIVADNLRKGAATNAIQIAEYWAANQDSAAAAIHTAKIPHE
jgi:aspartate-semialdehyde dehydrogenase